MHTQHRDFSVLNQAEGVLQVHIAQADGFYLRTCQLNTGLVLLFDKIIVKCLAVFGDNLYAIAHGGHLLSQRVSNPVYHRKAEKARGKLESFGPEPGQPGIKVALILPEQEQAALPD